MRALCGRFGLGLLALLWGASHAQADDVRKVQVQKGDTLSGISAREVGRPIYGAHGSLRKVIQLNPQLKNPNHIRIGQWVSVPAPAAAPVLSDSADSSAAPIQPPVPMKESAREDLLAIPLQPSAPKAAAPTSAGPAPTEPAKELTVQIQSPSAAEFAAPPAPESPAEEVVEAPRRVEQVIRPVSPVSRTPEPRSLSGSEPRKVTNTPAEAVTIKESRASQLEALRAQLWLQARLDQVRRGEVVNRGIASTNVMDFRRFYAEQLTSRMFPAQDVPRWSVLSTRE